MGVEVKLTFFAENESVAESAARAVYDRFEDLEQTMSDYRPTSEVRVLQEKAVGSWVRVSKDLWTVLAFGKQVSEATNGAFDMTAGPYVALWREARRTGKSPSYDSLLAARTVVGWRYVELEPAGRRVRVEKQGVKIDLGGIAKGYACDEAIKVFERFGIRRASVVAGGDLKVSGAPPGRTGWPVTVAGEPVARDLAHVAVSTSGDTEQFVEIWGRLYSHIVDPRNGFGVSNRIQATVVARSGLVTDPLATALCVTGDAGVVEPFGGRAWLVATGPEE